MTIFKRYFTYHFKNTFLRFAIIAVFSALWVLTRVWESFSWGGANISRVNLNVLSTIAIIISTLIPILELLPFKNRRNMDTILFLPLERRKMGAVHFINGFVQIFFINLVCFTATFFVLTIHSYPFKTWNLFLLFLFTLFGSLVIYSVTSFIFDRANTAADGIIWIIVYLFIGYFMFDGAFKLYKHAIDAPYLYSKNTDFVLAGCLTPYHILLNTWERISDLLIPKIEYRDYGFHIQTITNDLAPTNIYNHNITDFILWSIIMVLCIFGFIWLFKNKRPENIGSISNSRFGYAVLIPLFSIAYLCNSFHIKTVISMLILMTIGYIVYRRSIRFKLIDYISIAVSLILPAILVLIAKSL